MEWEEGTDEPFGDALKTKEEETTRIAFLNIGGIPPVNSIQKTKNFDPFLG